MPGRAGVEGYVLDPSESRISGAQVAVHNTETGYARRVTTDAQGRFSILPLPTGVYSVSVVASGFVADSIEVPLTVGTTESLLFRLRLEAVTEQVVVTESAAASPVEMASAGSLLSSRMIADLPVRSRHFADLVQLSPAVVQEDDRLGLVIAGQRSIQSNVAIDGADFNDPLQGNQRGGNESAFFFPQAAIKGFQVVRSGATAEVGRTSSGFVNAVTKSGTNDLHGELFYFNRNRHLTAPDAFGRRLDNGQHQLGGAFGGPLSRDRAFFFLGVEQNFLRVPFVVEFDSQADLPPELVSKQGAFFGTNNPTVAFARADLRLNANHLLNVDYSYSRLRGENFNFDSPRLSASPTPITRVAPGATPSKPR